MRLSQNLSKRTHCPIRCHFVVLNFLRRCDDAGVANRFVSGVGYNIFSFADEGSYSFAFLRIHFTYRVLQYLFQTRHVSAGLLQMGLESLFQLRIARLFDHFRQSFCDLRFGGVEMLQFIHIKFPEIVEICRHEFHDFTPA